MNRSRWRSGLDLRSTSPSGVARTHLFENMPACTVDMAGNQFGRLVGFSRLYKRDELRCSP
jgi:hypothetical protein